MLSRQLFDPAVTSHADADRLLRTEPQVQLTNPPVLNNHSNDFKSRCTCPFIVCRRNGGKRFAELVFSTKSPFEKFSNVPSVEALTQAYERAKAPETL
jgi:hypothetical protein